MIVCEDQIRLTRKEREHLAGLTGADPVHIKSMTQLESFIRLHAARLSNRGPGACLAKRLLLSFIPASPAHAPSPGNQALSGL